MGHVVEDPVAVGAGWGGEFGVAGVVEDDVALFVELGGVAFDEGPAWASLVVIHWACVVVVSVGAEGVEDVAFVCDFVLERLVWVVEVLWEGGEVVWGELG